MPSHPAPPLNEDFRLVEALQAQRPGAVGHVYNVYGPELAEYAEGLLGDRDRAVEAVRSALLALRDGGGPALDAGTFRDRLYALVREHCGEHCRDHCRERPARARWPVAVIGAAAAAALTAGMLALFESTDGGSPPPGPPAAMTTPTERAKAPSPEPTEPISPTEPAEREERIDPPEREKEAAGPARKSPKRGRLAVDDRDCRGVRAAALPRTCRIRLTAAGGPVRWRVASVRSTGGRISASGGGTLASGHSVSVPVTVRSTVRCSIGGRGGGTVAFSPAGTATVAYTCFRL